MRIVIGYYNKTKLQKDISALVFNLYMQPYVSFLFFFLGSACTHRFQILLHASIQLSAGHAFPTTIIFSTYLSSFDYSTSNLAFNLSSSSCCSCLFRLLMHISACTFIFHRTHVSAFYISTIADSHLTPPHHRPW